MARTGRPRQFNRDDALKKAMTLFWQKGFEDTSLAELRKTLGNLSAASFYAAFGSKQALYCECLELYTHSCGEFTSELENVAVSPKQAMMNMLNKTISMQTSSATPLGCMAVLSGLNCCDENKKIEELTLSVRNNIRQSLQGCIQRGVDAGELSQEFDIEGFTTLLDTFLNGISIQARDGIKKEPLLASANLLLSLWH